MMLEPGSSIAGYRVERVLGSGGMGTVYLARHPELPRSDAIKILEPGGMTADPRFRRRFMREAELAAGLDHPNIVTIHTRGRSTVELADLGPTELLWIAMQYVDGTDCARELRAQGRLDPRRVTQIIADIAGGLDHAHRRGLLHRDIKPGNILLSAGDGLPGHGERVVLTDFGVAKVTDDVDMLTSVGTVIVTLSYASPEQLSGKPMDGRTDQYSLAATAFHLLTGHVPFDHDDNAGVINAHLTGQVPRVTAEVDRLSPAVDAVIAKGMAKTPGGRFTNCSEFADALTMAIRGVVGVPTASLFAADADAPSTPAPGAPPGQMPAGPGRPGAGGPGAGGPGSGRRPIPAGPAGPGSRPPRPHPGPPPRRGPQASPPGASAPPRTPQARPVGPRPASAPAGWGAAPRPVAPGLPPNAGPPGPGIGQAPSGPRPPGDGPSLSTALWVIFGIAVLLIVIIGIVLAITLS